MDAVQQADRRRAEIVAAAAALFEAEGYSTTSMERLADMTGIRKPTLYHYFPSKSEILQRIHDEFIVLLQETFTAREATGASPSERLHGSMTDILDLMRSHRGHVRVFFDHHRELPPEGHAKISAKRDAYFAQITALIDAGVEAGELRPVDSHLTGLAIFGMCNWAYNWYNPDGPLTPEQISDYFWRLLIEGIGTPDTEGAITEDLAIGS